MNDPFAKITAERLLAKPLRRLCAIFGFVLFLAALLVLAHSGEIHAAASILLGDQTVESTQDFDTAGSAEAFQTTATTSGTVGSVTVYIDPSNKATHLIVGLYSSSSGSPKTLLSQGTSATMPTAGAWNTVAISPAAVTANTVYWIAVLGTGGTLYYRDGGTNCSSVSSTQTTLTSMPTSWSTGHTWSSCRLSGYGSASASNSPILSVSASTISFSATQGGANPASSSVSVTNTGTGGALSYTAASDTPSWLSVTPTSGTTASNLQISAVVGTLTAGTYTGHITVTSSGAQGSPATITVTFTVAPPPTLSLSTNTLSFNATQGGTNPASSSVSVANAGGGGALSYAAASDTPSWLSVTPLSGTTTGTLQISAVVGTLTPASYTGHITVTSNGAQGSPATITVTFIVAAPTGLTLSTKSLSFNATQGGANPASSPVSVTNTGGGRALNYTAASDSTSWLAVSPSSGKTPGTLQVSVTVGNRTAGTYTGHITVTSNGAQGSPATVTVTFNVAPQLPTLSLSTNAVSFSATQGGTDPVASSAGVANAGSGGALSYTTVTDSSSSSWLSVTPSNDTTPGTLHISAVLGTLTAGTYTGYVTVTSSGAQGSPATITVTFNVAPPPPVLSLSTTAVSLGAIQGSGTNSIAAPVGVTNSIGGPLSFSAASDSAWLSVTPSSGSNPTPSFLQITAAPGTLLVGTYTGHVTVTAPGAQGSPATITATFAVAPILGDSNIESIADVVPPHQAQAIQAMAAATGAVNSLTLYLDPTSAASQIYVGIYADSGGHPGALLGQGNIVQEGSSALPAGWNSIAISTGNTSAPNVAVTGGATYWIAVLGAQGSAPVYRAASMIGCPSESSSESNLTALPAQWTPGSTASACPASIFAMVTPNISGTISGIPSGAGPAVVTLSGASSATTTADASGNYSFSAVANTTFTITPSDAGYTFSLANQTVNINSSSVAGVNFKTLYSISGNVGAGAGVTVYLGGARSGSTVTDSSGNYSFNGLSDAATYTVTPSDIAYLFSPSVQSITIAGANTTDVNFTAGAAPPTFSISGTLSNPSNAGAGAVVTVTGPSTSITTTADSKGNYVVSGLSTSGGPYTVTPTSQTAIFSPLSQTVPVNVAGVTGVNFTATAVIFYDDFLGTTLNPAWVAMNRHGDYSNNELQCYLPSPPNVAVSGGFLTIGSLFQNQSCGDSNHAPSTSHYTSGMIQWNSIKFTYGTIEFRAQMAGGQGTWPAIWLLGSNCQASNVLSADSVPPCNWPAPGSDEIDITEILYSDHAHVNQGIHTGSHNNACTATTTDVSKNYHVYDLIWTSGSLVWQIDGKTTCTINQTYVPSTPMFLIINTAVGGSGDAPTSSTFPQTTSIDYIKVTPP